MPARTARPTDNGTRSWQSHRRGQALVETALVVPRLPKTRSGKTLRGTMRKIADGEAYTAPATIDDTTILPEIADALKTAGYANKG